MIDNTVTCNREIDKNELLNYLEEVNNVFFSGVLNIINHKNSFFLEYEDASVNVNIFPDKMIGFRYRPGYINNWISNLMTQYIAAKYQKDSFDENIFNEIDGEHKTAYQETDLKSYYKYLLRFNSEIYDEELKRFVKKIKRNKILNKIKIYLNLY